MNCRGCGGDAIGLLDGESVCGGCAAMVSFAEKMAEERRRFPMISFDSKVDAVYQVMASARPIEYLGEVVRRRAAASWSRGWARLVEIQRLNEEWLFFARAREAAANGGCRV